MSRIFAAMLRRCALAFAQFLRGQLVGVISLPIHDRRKMYGSIRIDWCWYLSHIFTFSATSVVA